MKTQCNCGSPLVLSTSGLVCLSCDARIIPVSPADREKWSGENIIKEKAARGRQMIQVAIQTRSPTLDVKEYVDMSNGSTRLIVTHASIIVADFRYQQCADMIQLRRFMVSKAVRRRGVGRAVIEHIKGYGMNIDVRLSERELVGQLFLSACGFRVVAILDGDDGDDDYVFRWEPEAK